MAGGVPAPDAQGETGPALALQNVYLKDCSYEAPNGPRVEGNWNPQINLDLHTGATGLAPDLREVVLTVTVSAKQNDVTIFLVEVKQAGIFLMRNLTEADVKRAVSSICPGVLFPYARASGVATSSRRVDSRNSCCRRSTSTRCTRNRRRRDRTTHRRPTDARCHP